MASIEIKLPPQCTKEEGDRIKEVLETQLNSKWDIFKRNAQAFFDSLKGLLGHLWNKIANWAKDFWNRIFG